MLFQTLTLSVVGLFFALGAIATETPIIEQEESTELGCSCKKRKKSSLKDGMLFACEGHDEPLEEEKV